MCNVFTVSHFSVDTWSHLSDDLTRVSCVWGNSKATTASFSWGSSCAIDLSACHMRTRRRRKERGWTHVYTGETISWLYFLQFLQEAKSTRKWEPANECLFSSFHCWEPDLVMIQYDSCVNSVSCLLGVLGTGTAAQLSGSLLPIVQSRKKRKRCWWDKLPFKKTRNFASKGFFSKKEGIRWNKDQHLES